MFGWLGGGPAFPPAAVAQVLTSPQSAHQPTTGAHRGTTNASPPAQTTAPLTRFLKAGLSKRAVESTMRV